MPPPDARSRAAAYLPGRGEIGLQSLGQGLFNDTYRARRDGRQFTLRLTRDARPEESDARAFEARLLVQAAACGLAPPLVDSDAALGILVLEWLPGEPWQAPGLGDAAHIAAAAGLIGRIHALPVPAPLRACTPAGWVSFYRQRLAARSHAAGESAALESQADRALQCLADLPGAVPVICHSDLHCLNVLRRTDRSLEASVLLDWEYAHQSEAAWDLAGWSANNDFTVEQSRALLAAYAPQGHDRIPWQRFVLLRWLFDYVCVLWMRLFRQAMPANGAGLAPRAGLLETRLQAAVCGKIGDSERQYSLEI